MTPQTPNLPNPSRRVLGAQYFVYFAVIGFMLPFFNLYCRRLGFSALQIGVLAGVRSGAIVCTPLLWAALADRHQKRKAIFVMANLASTGFFSLYFLSEQFWPMLAITLGYALFNAPIISFLEAFAMEILGKDRARYGRTRVWGSLSFILCVLAMGKILDHAPIRILLPLVVTGSMVLTGLSFFMPRTGKREPAPPLLASLRHFAKPRVILFQGCAFLMLASHGAYYGFFSIRLAELGFSDAFIGAAWALASLSEILVLLRSHAILGRFGPRAVMGFALFAAALRWTLLAFSSSAWSIAGLQLLHAATYACFHVASILYMDSLVPASFRTLGQALNNSVTYGLGMAVGVIASGALFERLGAQGAFLASAATALAGALLFAAFAGRAETRRVS